MDSTIFYAVTDQLLREIWERQDALLALEKIYFNQKTNKGCRPGNELLSDNAIEREDKKRLEDDVNT